jgi:hypothetical protein
LNLSLEEAFFTPQSVRYKGELTSDYLLKVAASSRQPIENVCAKFSRLQIKSDRQYFIERGYINVTLPKTELALLPQGVAEDMTIFILINVVDRFTTLRLRAIALSLKGYGKLGGCNVGIREVTPTELSLGVPLSEGALLLPANSFKRREFGNLITKYPKLQFIPLDSALFGETISWAFPKTDLISFYEELLVSSPHPECEYITSYLATSRRAKDLDLNVPRLFERANLKWYEECSLARWERYGKPPFKERLTQSLNWRLHYGYSTLKDLIEIRGEVFLLSELKEHFFNTLNIELNHFER